MSYFMLLAWTLACLITPNEALSGYHCKNRKMNVTTISTIDVAGCDTVISEMKNKPEIKEKFIQLLQHNQFTFVEVVQCKIFVTRYVYRCESKPWYKTFFGLLKSDKYYSTIPGGYQSFIYDISKTECISLQGGGNLKLFKLNNYYISGIPNNNTDTVLVNIPLQGWITPKEGKCGDSGSYADQYDNYKQNVVAVGTITVSLNKQKAKVGVEDKKLYLSSGTSCDFSLGTCRDGHYGPSFWETLPPEQNTACSRKSDYSVIYRGNANVSILDNEQLYIVEESSMTFSLLKKKNHVICEKTVIVTEHPKLFIYLGNDTLSFAAGAKDVVNNDLFSYINSKFVYFERHVRKQVEKLHGYFRKRQCELERNILINQLSIAVIQPEEFAYRFLGQAGYMAVIAGEVIHLAQCTQVELEVRPTDKCYEYLPVQIKVASNQSLPIDHVNETLFITPHKHILVDYSPEIPCSKILPQCWLIDGTWYKFIPTMEKMNVTPNSLKPSEKVTWKWKKAENLGSSGIYSQEEADRLNDRILVPMTNKARVEQVIEKEIRDVKDKRRLSNYFENLFNGLKELVPDFVVDLLKSIVAPLAAIFDAVIRWTVLFGIVGFVIFAILRFRRR